MESILDRSASDLLDHKNVKDEADAMAREIHRRLVDEDKPQEELVRGVAEDANDGLLRGKYGVESNLNTEERYQELARGVLRILMEDNEISYNINWDLQREYVED